MDAILGERLNKIAKQIKALRDLEEGFFRLEAHEKVLFGSLFSKVEGKSIEDRKAAVHSSKPWADFTLGLSIAHAEYLEAKRTYELKLKAFDAEYLTFKIEEQAIRRGVSG